jgi:starch phosphorylase
VAYDIHFGGWVEKKALPKGRPQCVWHAEEMIKAVAYDTPVLGWRERHVNPLRLWSARAVDPLHLSVFNEGDHLGAFSPQARAEALSKILYPSDDTASGRELRLRQEYFFVSASLQDLVRRHTRTFGSIYALPERAAIQLNDTHPSVAIAELMRILVDLHNVPWDEAWKITVETFSYTNHTLLPEALETWSVPLFERLLPRHLEIIYAINARHLEAARRTGQFDHDQLTEISLIDESDGRRVRMGHLAFVGSHRVNGVSALHTGLMRTSVFSHLHRLYPNRIVNKTNGISFRRWLHQANPGLTKLLCEACGPPVLDNPAALGLLGEQADDRALQARLTAVKRANKVMLARIVRERLGLQIDPSALFDVQIKRIHEYKRQLLNILDAIARYRAILADPSGNWVPRVKIFSGKAAPSYSRAKLIIKLANDVANVINNDPLVGDLLKIVFLPNYNVSLAELVIPAADLSEQISTAGMEASGTGNMKLALNGALTVGTFDGANIEIGEHVGEENIFIFGLRAAGVAERRSSLDATEIIAASPDLSEVVDALVRGYFSPDDPQRFAGLVNMLRYSDRYMVAADFEAYRAAQREVDELWQSPLKWCRAALLNIAGMAWFSSDRAIAQYADEIWNIPVSGKPA